MFPRVWWPSTNAVPGVRGPAIVPATALVAKDAFTSSDSKNSSSMSAMDVKMIRRRKSSASGVRTSDARSARDTGGASNVGSTSSAKSSQNRAYRGQGSILLRELRHLLPIPILFVPIEQEPPVREGLEEGRIVDVLLQAERWEIEVGLDFGPQEAAGVRERRGAEPGMNFLRDARAAHDGATLEDEDLEARLREVRG